MKTVRSDHHIWKETFDMTILRKLAAPALASLIGLGTTVSAVHAAPTHQISYADRGDRSGDKGDKGQHDQGDKGDKGGSGDKGGNDGGPR